MTPKTAAAINNNSTVRRSMRETKRPKFDDELVQSIPLTQTLRKRTLNERPSPELIANIEMVFIIYCDFEFFGEILEKC